MIKTFDEFIKNPVIHDFFVQKIGEEGLELIEILFKSRKYISEFVLAERSGIYVNTVRSLLYKLYEDKIVSYTRKREKSRGWYIYSWMIHLNKLFNILIRIRNSQINGLNSKLEAPAGEQQFYCKKCDVKLAFSNALEYNFSCPSCYNPMNVFSEKIINRQNKAEIIKLKNEINELKEINKMIKETEPVKKKKKKAVKKKKIVKKPKKKKKK